MTDPAHGPGELAPPASGRKAEIVAEIFPRIERVTAKSTTPAREIIARLFAAAWGEQQCRASAKCEAERDSRREDGNALPIDLGLG